MLAADALDGTALAQDLPIVIAHRGASGFRPEHTIEAYALAIAQGADFIEPDLVATRDGHLLARHEHSLASVRLDDDGEIVRDQNGKPVVTSATTNVAHVAEFAERVTVKTIGGKPHASWFSEDFTLAELKRLRARERIPQTRPNNTRYDDLQLVTLKEVLLLVDTAERVLGRRVGIYPETKHPTYFARTGRFADGTPIGLSLADRLVDTLVAHDFTDPARVFIQSFEVEPLLHLQRRFDRTPDLDLPLVQLFGNFHGNGRPTDFAAHSEAGSDLNVVYRELARGLDGGMTSSTGYRELATASGLRALAAAFAEGVGPAKTSLLPRTKLERPVDGNGDGVAAIRSQLTGVVSPFISDALAAGLKIHPYTLRSEEGSLTLFANGRPQSIQGEVIQLLSLGIHGIFIDQPIDGVRGRTQFLRANGLGYSQTVIPDQNSVDGDYARLLNAYTRVACDTNPLWCRRPTETQ